MTKDVISLSISVLLLFRHYISHKITFGAPSSGGVLCSACGAFIISYGKFLGNESSKHVASILSGKDSESEAESVKYEGHPKCSDNDPIKQNLFP